MSRVLGLDLSLRATGICVLSGISGQQDIKTELLAKEKANNIEESIRRLLAIANEIVDIITNEKILSVVIEAPAMNQKWQAAAIGELHGVVKTKIYTETGIVPLVEQATKLRKAVVGTISSVRKQKKKDNKIVNSIDYGLIAGKREGTFKKATIKDIVELRLKEQGLNFPTQDECDAYVAARFGWDQLEILEKS